MSEPEDLILDGAHFATRVVRDVWTRYGSRAATAQVPLASVRMRLELFVTALFQRAIPIAAMEPPAPRTWLSRLATGRPRESPHDPLACGTDGSRVYLPPSLDVNGGHAPVAGVRSDAALPGAEAAIALYRLMAVQQGARLVRGTAVTAARIRAGDTRDWFLLAEGAAVDRWVAVHTPGLEDALRAARSDALARRGRLGDRYDPDHAIERQLRAVLAADPQARVLEMSAHPPVEESLAWAHDASKRHPATERYRSAVPVWLWGRPLEPSSFSSVRRDERSDGPLPEPGRRARVAAMRRRPRPREAPEDEDDERCGTWVIRADEPQESVEDPFGLQRPADHDEHADPEGLADSLSDLPEARVVRTAGQAREVLLTGEEMPRGETAARGMEGPRRGTAYPEWDYRTACTVSPAPWYGSPPLDLEMQHGSRPR